MDESVSDRVRRVMEAVSVSQAAFAERVRLTPDKLSKSLTGVRRFTSLDLALIAEAGDTTVDWLLTGRAPSRPSFAARTTDESMPERDKVEQVAQRYTAAYEVLELLGRLPKLPALPDVRTELALHIDQGRQLAEGAARGLAATGEWATGRETDALIAACAKAYGVDVAITALPDGVNGVTWQTDTFRLILVSPSSVWTRQRFTLAHELGHILARDAQDPMVEKRIRPGRVKDLTEVRANAFASHLLMPAPEVEKRFRQAVAADGQLGRDAFARLVVEFKVSPSALAVPLGQLGLIDKDVRTRSGSSPRRRATRWRELPPSSSGSWPGRRPGSSPPGSRIGSSAVTRPERPRCGRWRRSSTWRWTGCTTYSSRNARARPMLRHPTSTRRIRSSPHEALLVPGQHGPVQFRCRRSSPTS